MARRLRRAGRELRDPLSRNEREQTYGTESGFTPPQNWLRCPSCCDWELTADVKLGEAKGSYVANPGCEECGGHGVIPARGKLRLDPYATPLAVAVMA